MRSGRHHWFRLGSDQRGAAMLELAIVLPVVMMLGMGAIEFGNMIYKDHLLWNGVRDGARYLARLPYDSTNTTEIAANDAKAKNLAVTGVTSGGTARVAGWTTTQVFVDYTPVTNASTCGTGGVQPCYRGASSITMVTVSTSFSYQSLGFMGFIGLGSTTLTASHQERLIGMR